MERLFSVTQEAACTGSLGLEEPYSQPGKNGISKFWNQWQVSKAKPEVLVGDSVVEEQTKLSEDNAEAALTHLMGSLSVGEQSEPASFQNYWPPGAEAFSDPVPSQDFACPYPLTLDLIDPVASINPYEEGGSSSYLVSLGAGASSSQPPSGLRKKSLIVHWKLLEAYGKSQKEESGEWYEAWQDALNFASDCAVTDYHFNLNVAIALTRLKCIDQAKVILLDQLTKFNDEKYISGVSKQLGFLFFIEGDFVNAIKNYMRGFSAIMDISNETYSYIYTSMKSIIRESTDQYFIFSAISWFNNLTPKTRENKVEITRAMLPSSLPLPSSRPSFSKRTEPAIKHSESGQSLDTVARWKELEAVAKAQTPGEPEWCEAWTCARDFALECAKEDYHFNLNAAIALTRLNHLDQAIEILFQQLHMLEHECDQAYFMGVNKQLGYIFYRKESYIDAVYYYMCGIDSSKAVPDIVYNYITTALGALGKVIALISGS